MFKKPEKSRMEHHKTKPENRVHPLVKTAYGTGMIAFTLLVSCYSGMVYPVFNLHLGVALPAGTLVVIK